MDVTILLILASTLIVLIIATLLLKTWFTKPGEAPAQQARAREAPGPRRAQAVRNARQRMRPDVVAEDSDEEDAPPEKDDIKLPPGKIGTKKRAKLEAKAEKKAQKEFEEREREERKKRREAADEERRREDEREKAQEEARLAEEKRIQEEKEKREHDEYLKLKATFSVAEEGYEQGEEDEENLLQEFIKYIKCNKVVILEDIAAHFKLKTQNVIERIQYFQANGTLTGVIDDRGKFICVSEEELQAIANFVKQRGRVSISELAESSNKLISLSPVEIAS